MDFRSLQQKIEFQFQKLDLLREALTHRSYLNERPDWPHQHNERLEFLGDAVLELVISEALFQKFPTYPEGQLTILRAALVNYNMLAKVAREFGLEKHILVSRGEAQDNGKAKEVILANAIEALIGAIYLDQGVEAVRKFIERFVMTHLDEVLRTKSYKDPKSELQEIIQDRMRVTPTYRVLHESGPAHDRRFRIGVYFNEDLIAEGEGSSKHEAETEAARNALKNFHS